MIDPMKREATVLAAIAMGIAMMAASGLLSLVFGPLWVARQVIDKLRQPKDTVYP